MFLGEFEHSLDAKRRLAIPAEIRDSWNVTEHGEHLVAIPGSNGHLWIWPSRLFDSVMKAGSREFLRDPKLVRFETHVLSKTAKLQFDSAGRVRIPDRLLEAYGLRDKVTILGIYDHLEVVDSGQWKSESVDPKSVGELYGAAFDARRAERS
jgi:MraZ protein